jgi:hypothetical protein
MAVSDDYGRHAPTFLFRLWRPMSWPRRIRRAFLLLLPLALPIWALLNLASVSGAFLRALGRLMGKYWNGPQRRYRRYGSYYGHVRDRRRGSSRSADDVS